MDIKDSVDRILESDRNLGEEFYARFFARYPDAAPFFEGIDLQQQGALLTMQLTVIMAHYKFKSSAPALYLQVLGTRHKNRGIPVEMYSPFADVLLEVLSGFFEDDWGDQLEDEWRSAIKYAADKMQEGYTQRFQL